MKSLKIISLCSLIIIQFFNIYYTLNNNKSKYDLTTNVIYGTVITKNTSSNKVSFIVKGKEKILVNDYNFISDISLGDKVRVKGKVKEVNSNTNFNLFNYKNYLLSKKVYYTFTLEEIEITKNKNFLYSIKNRIINRLDSINNSYLYTFILADNKINDEIYETYRNNGISHLFAVSGMHISLLSIVLFFLLKIVIKNKKIIYIIISIFLLLYMFLTSFTASVVRCSLAFILTSLLNIFNIKVKSIYVILIILNILIIYNPFYIYDIGFIYSFIISISLILFKDSINKYKNYFIKLFITSLIAFLVSFPITINNNFNINLLTPFINLFFVPFVSFILFPCSLVTFFIPKLNFIFDVLIIILEKVSLIFNKISINLIIPFIPWYFIIIYYIFIYVIFKKKKKFVAIILFIILVLFINKKYFYDFSSLTVMDVGQGDSLLLEFKHNKGNILIDTGGNINYSLSENILEPYLKSRGINKIDYLLLTHGDFDHMGEAINLVNNFKVENVIFNCGEFNDLEKELISVLNKKKIKYYSCIKELNFDNNKLYFLNNKDYENENDNSIVLYTELNDKKFLFMGDASVKTEKDIMNKYNLEDIDVIKVGHHGSKTSSSEEFINSINPKYSVISVGKNNRYNHPNSEVLKILDKSKIYRTDIDGSVMFEFNKDKLEISTCPP